MAKLSELVVGTSVSPGLVGGMPFDLDDFGVAQTSAASGNYHIGETIATSSTTSNVASGALVGIGGLTLDRGVWLVTGYAMLTINPADSTINIVGSPTAGTNGNYLHFTPVGGNTQFHRHAIIPQGTYTRGFQDHGVSVSVHKIMYCDGTSIYLRQPGGVNSSATTSAGLFFRVHHGSTNLPSVKLLIEATRIA